MDCERYMKWIKDAAAGELPGAARPRGARPAHERELQAHLAGCGRCRASLERERRLLAAIDRSLSATAAAAEPSAEFAAGVRMRITEQQARQSRGWFVPWMPIATGALAATLAVAIWVGRKHKTNQAPTAGSVAAKTPATERNRSEERPAVARKETPKSPSRAGRGRVVVVAVASRRHAPAAPGGPDLEILVPKGQAAAVMQLYNSVWDGSQEETVAAGAGGQGTLAEATAKPLEIEPLKVEPLESSTLEAELARPAPPESGPDGAKGSDR